MTRRIEQTIETICQQGCGHVRRVIRELEADNWTALAGMANDGERRLVLAELKAIMAVYDERANGCCPTVIDPMIGKVVAGY